MPVKEARDPEQLEAELEALRDSKERLDLALQGAGLGLWDADIGSGEVVYNERWAEMLGYTLEEVASDTEAWQKLVHPEDLPKTRAARDACLAGETPAYEAEHRLRTKTGEWKWILSRGNVVERDAQGKPLRVTGTHLDITERKRAEEILRITQFSVDRAPDAIYWMERDARLVYVNDAACRSLGYTREELLTMTVHDIDLDFPAENWPAHWTELQEKRCVKFESRHRRKDGSVFPVEITANFLEYDGRQYNCASVHDITERKRAETERREWEARSRQTEKLRSLHVMAGAIAHNYNNLLMAVLGNLELARSDLDRGSVAAKLIQEALQAARRAAELSTQLLVYAGQGRDKLSKVDLAKLAGEVAESLRATGSEAGRLRTELSPGTPAIQGDPSQLRQVVRHLVANAAEAMQGPTGEITLAAGAMECDADYLRGTYLKQDLPPGPYAWIEVADNGPGMGPATLEKIFDPFFTTKFTGRGLGLSTVFGIVRGHHGAIDVSSQPGRGSVFRALFPAVETHSAEAAGN